MLAEWHLITKNDKTFYALSFSSRKTAIAIKCYSGLKARMSLNAIIAVVPPSFYRY
jgi:hypothetical protein